MRGSAGGTTIAALLALLLLASAGSASATIVRIVDSGTGAPIAGATVTDGDHQ